ncbi:hypothetical protein LXH09_05515 [Streptomyces sp. CS7]|uniref:hypothetical protein n=1 Tax=Streptomyces sp. CS-7 TaxID=2906769 RepID=UPI0021B316C3|nr:hypothetical protein [Streptomyces sp. CS-7]MCT6776081.1 hypothetical protein [Streptomyces sp. CS-7]
MSDEREALWDKLKDMLNEMEAAGISVGFGSFQGHETDWYSIPWVSSQRTQTIEITWSMTDNVWKRGREFK